MKSEVEQFMQHNTELRKILKAKILTSTDCGISHDEVGTIDGNPDRTNIVLEGINCSTSDFIKCFLESDEGNNFCHYSDGKTLSDIGGSRLDLTPGSIIQTRSDYTAIAELHNLKERIELLFLRSVVPCKFGQSYWWNRVFSASEQDAASGRVEIPPYYDAQGIEIMVGDLCHLLIGERRQIVWISEIRSENRYNKQTRPIRPFCGKPLSKKMVGGAWGLEAFELEVLEEDRNVQWRLLLSSIPKGLKWRFDNAPKDIKMSTINDIRETLRKLDAENSESIVSTLIENTKESLKNFPDHHQAASYDEFDRNIDWEF